MTPEREREAQGIFMEAIRRPSADRRGFVADRCDDDAELRARVEALLVADASDDVPGPTIRTPSRRDPKDEHPDIGSYCILHSLGRGGMGEVYLAIRDNGKFRQRVALKVVKRGMDTDEVIRRFDRERHVLATLNHPGIARLYDAGVTDDGRPYFAMEYIEGLTLHRYCERNKLNIEERLQLFSKICGAVHFAHRNMVVHRDLKPDNILITADGQPKLLDFGIAKLISPTMSAMLSEHTSPDQRLMTPRYASPEQVRGDPITPASDVYTLGVILFELLTGHTPYRLTSRVRREVERVICEVEPDKPSTAISRIEEALPEDTDDPTEPPGTITPESVSRTRGGRPDRLRRRLAGDIDNIVLMALRKEPTRRYDSALELARDLERHLEFKPVQARRDSIGYRASRFVRRNRAAVTVAAVIALLLAGGVGGITYNWQRAEENWKLSEVNRRAALDNLQLAEDRGERLEAARLEEAAQRERAEHAATLAEEQRELALSREREARAAEAYARDARTLSEAMFGHGRALAGDVLIDLARRIRRLDGGMPARRALVESGVAYLDGVRMLAESGDSIVEDVISDHDALIHDLARGYDEMGRLAWSARADSEGDVADARVLYQRGIDLLQPLLSRGDDAYARSAAQIRLHLGDTYRDEGRVDEARPHYQQVATMLSGLVQADPDDVDALRLLAVTRTALVDISVSEGAAAAARRQLEELLAVRRDLLAIATDAGQEEQQRRDAREVSVVQLRIAELDAREGDYERAHAIAHTERLDRERRVVDGNSTSVRDVAWAMLAEAEYLLELGRGDEALSLLETAIATYRRRLDGNPASARAIIDLIHPLRLLARAMDETGNADEARSLLESAKVYAEQALVIQPDFHRTRTAAVMVEDDLAALLAKRGQHDAARTHWKAALGMLEKLIEDAPLQDFLVFQAQVRLRYAECLIELGEHEHDAARAQITRAIQPLTEASVRAPAFVAPREGLEMARELQDRLVIDDH